VRALFLLLLLANILFFAWTQWVAPTPVLAGRPTPSSADPHAIRLLREAPLAEELSVAVAGSGLADVAGDSVTCVSGGPFAERIAAEQAAARLESLGFTSRLRASRDQVWVGQWVRVENLATAEDAANTLATLRAAGIVDAYVLTDEPPGNVVSLGVFGEAARAAQAASIARQAGFTPRTEDRFRTEDVFWLDVDRRANAGLPGLEVFRGEGSQPTRLELRPCPEAAEAATPVAKAP
jgi:hypothetical protein